MELSLKGRVALVTGAGRGIGRAIALELAGNGADVAVGDIRLGRYQGEAYYRLPRRVSGDEENVPTADAVRALGARAIGLEFDVADGEQVKRAVAKASAELGPIDILVNNAAIVTNIAAITAMERAAWDRELAVNLTGAFACIQATVAGMAERGWGRIISIASVAAETPLPLQPAYSASKAGVIALTKAVAKAYARHGVTCNAILPGLIATPLVRSMPVERRDDLVRYVPARRLGEMEEIAAVVAFLASPAAAFVNGAPIPVDGGWLTGLAES